MASIQVRTDGTLKKKAQKILKDLGLDLSSAVNLYLKQIVITESVPFPIRTVNGFTSQQEKQMLEEMEDAVKHGKRYDSVDELFRDILGEWPPRKKHRSRRARS